MDNRYSPNRNSRKTVASWPLIITLCFIFPPVGLILLLVRLNDRNKDKSREYRHRYYRESGGASGHIYVDDHDSPPPPRYMNERKSAGKASFIVSLVFFFVGGIILVNALETLLWGWSSSFFQQAYIGLCFVGVGLYLIWPRRRMGRTHKGMASFIVSASLFFVGGIIIISILDEFWYFGFYSGIGASMFIGMCFILAGFLVIRPRNRERTRNDLYDRYANIVGQKRAVAVWDIAVSMPVSMSKAYSDLQKMINLGYFEKTAFLDKKIGYLLMDTEAYNEIPKENEKTEAKAEAEEERGHIDKNEFASILKEIQKYNETIADPILSEQVDRLESIASKIFRAVEEDPEKRPQIQKFLDYYLPTTLKLIKTYSQLERQGESGENITNTKIKIEDIMEELVGGYERLLDQLYKGDVMDISSDIEVLETMMAKDGYSEKNRIQLDKD